jgi:hypothetical protein
MTSFKFEKKIIDPGDLVTRSKPGPLTEPGLKTMDKRIARV